MDANAFRIESVGAASPLLRDVKELGRAHRSTLGFFPNGAFDDHAERRWIVAAVEVATGRCVGYILYRCSETRVTLVHLCVAPECRGQKIARMLVEHLVAKTRDMVGIRLRCRRDYGANDMWPSLGFVAQSERVGRSIDGKELVFWWRDHGNPTLFSHVAESTSPGRIQVIIDRNVFIDLHGELTPEAEESRLLLADWLSDIELCVTDEMFNEIARDDDEHRRRHQRNLATHYRALHCPSEEFGRAYESLRPLFADSLTTQDSSDLCHLARSAGAGAKFFVTRDESIRRKADDVYSLSQMLIMRPADIITHFDQILREQYYQPSRLAGTQIQRGRPVARCEDELAAAFQPHSQQTKAGFLSQLRPLLADPRTHECVVVRSPDGHPISLIALSRGTDRVLRVPVLRVSRRPLARTLARYMLFDAIVTSVREGMVATWVTDEHVTPEVQEVLREEMFWPVATGWAKLNPRFIGPTADLLCHLGKLLSEIPTECMQLGRIPSIVGQQTLRDDPAQTADIERLLWPAKLTDAGLRSFVVPIKPMWAQHLFDENLARQNLFGAHEELALQRESAYYRRRGGSRGISAPARILWYVSDDPNFDGSGCIRACSHLEEVLVGSAKEMYGRFRRFGVYTRDDLMRLTDGDISKEVMVLRFSDTELFANPIPRGKLLWSMLGGKDTMQSPLPISADAFSRVYSHGIGGGLS